MQRLFLLLVVVGTIVTSCATATRGASVPECDLGIAVRATGHDVNDDLVGQLFETANEDCSSETAFMQVFNEALFNTLDSKPQSFLHYYSSHRSRSFILEQLANPVHDSIDIPRILEQLRRMTPSNQ